jgi:indole-3-glycerol phosphate synthase
MTATTGTLLDAIVADTRTALAAAGPAVDLPAVLPPIRSLRSSVEAHTTLGTCAVIAEHKRRSPSRGVLAPAGDSVDVRTRRYETAGAAGISVLTEARHFAGGMEDLCAARAATGDVPLLCKDFIVDERQLIAARMAGADAALLIAALYDRAALARMVATAHGIGLEVLLEVHDAVELERALATDADLIGINARDLRSFTVDLAVVEALAPLVSDRPVVAESGIHGASDVRRVQRAGAAAVLVGERLMTAPDPAAVLAELRAAGAT